MHIDVPVCTCMQLLIKSMAFFDILPMHAMMHTPMHTDMHLHAAVEPNL